MALLLCFSHLAFISSAQDNNTKRKISIGAFVSPEYSWLRTQSIFNKLIEPAIGITAGFAGKINLGEKWFLSLGVQYSAKAYKTPEILFDNPLNDPLIPAGIVYKYKDHYIAVPLLVEYSPHQHKISPFVSAGISSNFFMLESGRSIQKFDDGSTKNSSQSYRPDIAPVNFQGQLGVGINIEMQNANLQVYPVGRISVTGADAFDSNARFLSVGLGVGYFIKL